MADLNAEISQDLKKRLDMACAERGVTKKVAVAEALEEWIHPKGKVEPTDPDPDVEMLRRFKEIGSAEDIKFLRGNILVFLRDAERTRRRKGG